MAEKLFENLATVVESKKEVSIQNQVATTEKRKVGRPRTAEGKVTQTVKIAIENKQRLQKAAFEHGTTASWIIDQLLERYLDDIFS